MTARILIADDEPAIVDGLAMLLADEGYAVLTALTGTAALAALADSIVDLLISDVMMPGLDGIGLVAELRRRGDGTPIVLMSAGMQRRDAPAGVRFLEKPFDLETLLTLVRDALASSQPSHGDHG